MGPPPPEGGPRNTCTPAPPSPDYPEPYFKTYTPVQNGPAIRQRYNMSGQPITIDEAHGNLRSPVPGFLRLPLGIGIFLWVMAPDPAY
jgi:hypothetical protein